MTKRVLPVFAMLALALLGWMLAYRLPSRSVPSRPSWAAIQEQAIARAQEGRPIVAAIYEYKNRFGLWPTSLRELVPEFISPEPLRGWHYHWHMAGWWQLTNYFDFPHNAARYERRKDKEGWQLTNGEDSIDLDIQQPRPKPRAISEKELLANFRTVMERRIAAEPRRMVHYEGEVSWYYQHNRLAEARAACRRCLEIWPEHWWPNVMLAILEARLGSFTEAEERLSQLTAAKGEFSYALLLAQFYFTTGRKQKACAVLKTALPLPIRDLKDDMYTIDQPLGMMAHRGPWKAAVMAYRAKCYDVTLAICSRWERDCNPNNWLADRSYHTIRAAIYLARGEFDRARAEAEEMIRLRQANRHLGDNVDELRNAIERQDKDFVYQTDEGLVKIFIEYE